MSKYDLLVQSNKRVFNVDDLVAIWSETDRRSALESIKGYIKRDKITNPFKGIYSLDTNYNELELGQKLFTPSYITYYTALAIHGIIFQKYSDIHLFASESKKVKVENQNYIFHKVKNNILLNTDGLEFNENYTIPTKERAICDSLYLNKDITFDNFREIDTKLLITLSRIYKNIRLEKDILKLSNFIYENNAK